MSDTHLCLHPRSWATQMTMCIFLLLSHSPSAQILRHSISSLGSVFSKIKGALVTPLPTSFIPWSLDRFPLAMTFQCLTQTQSRVGGFSAAQQICSAATWLWEGTRLWVYWGRKQWWDLNAPSGWLRWPVLLLSYQWLWPMESTRVALT